MSEDLNELKENIGALYDEAISNMREPDLIFDKWNVAYFIEATPLTEYLNSTTELIGQKINTVLTLGCIFNEEDILAGGGKYLSLDEPVVVIIGSTQFEVWFYTVSRVKIGVNTLTLKEKSYQPSDWRNCSKFFSDAIIGQKVVGFEVIKSEKGVYDSLGLGDRPDGGDYFESFRIVLENGKYLEFSGSIEYMIVSGSLGKE